MPTVVPAVDGFIKRKKVFDASLCEMLCDPLFVSGRSVSRIPEHLVLDSIFCQRVWFGINCDWLRHRAPDTASPRQFEVHLLLNRLTTSTYAE
jgi:hypothetical protein